MEYPVIDLQETGKRIRALRKERRLSVRTVCEFMGGISPQAVYKWEAGICLPSLDNMYALSILFQVSINDMIEETRQVSSFLSVRKMIPSGILNKNSTTC